MCAWGVQAIVTQSLLLREALVLMFGSEFAWGIVLFAWLFGVAAGAVLGGRLARGGRADLRLVTVLLTLSAVACAELWVFRGARAWLGIAPGELLPLAKTAAAAMVFVSPAGTLVGMAFPLACCVINHGGPQVAAHDSGPLGEVYALEAAGSLLGGAAFSFWAVEHLAPIETALACGTLTAAASGGLLAITARRPVGAGLCWATALAALLAAVLGGDALNRRLVERRWHDLAPGYEVCTEAESKYQNLAVARRAQQYTLYCDGQVAGDFPDPYSSVPAAHFWMYQHPAPRHVLVLGGGVEGLLAEILHHPVEHVDYVEPDPRQIEILRPFLDNADRRALADERVTVHHADARHFVKTQRERFDLVIARLPEPMSALRARFYTDEFWRELRRTLTPRSVVCLTVAAAPGELSLVSGEYLASVRATLRRHLPHVTVGWGDPAQVLAATEPGLTTTDLAELERRQTERGVESPLFHPLLFAEQLDPVKLQRRAAALDAVERITISTDLRPTIYIQRLMLWDRMTSGRMGGIIERLRSIGLFELASGLTLLGAVTVLAGRLRRGSASGWAAGALALSIGTTGFATMALSIVWLFAFQNLYGYVYGRIGWIIALFMAGLMAGCWWVGWRSKCAAKASGLMPYLWRRLIIVDVLLALLALAAPLVLPALGALQSTQLTFILVEWSVSIMVTFTGVLGGAAFALAGGLQLSMTRDTAIAAGTINGADHAGACLGALLTGIALVPVFGTATAAFLLGGVKLGSAVLLLALRPPGLPTEAR